MSELRVYGKWADKPSLETRASSAFVQGRLLEACKPQAVCECSLGDLVAEIVNDWKQAEAELAKELKDVNRVRTTILRQGGVMDGMSLKFERLKRRWSQWDLSERTGIRNYRLSLIECGRVVPTDGEREALSAALHLDPATDK